MTIQPDDGYEELRAAVGRLHGLLNTRSDTYTEAEIREALAGPEVSTHHDPDRVRTYIHRQTRHLGMLYTADTATTVRAWVESLPRSAGQAVWDVDDDPEFPGSVWLTTNLGPSLLRYGDTVMLDPSGRPYPVTPDVLPLSFHEEH